MNSKTDNVSVLVSALLITAIFYQKNLGLNLFIFELTFVFWLVVLKQYRFKGFYAVSIGLGLLLTLIFSILSHSILVYVIHFLLLIGFVGVLSFPNAKSLMGIAAISISNTWNSQLIYWKRLLNSQFGKGKPGRLLWKSRIFIIPTLIILFFLHIYAKANPVFGSIINNISLFIEEKLSFLFEGLDIALVITFIFSFILSTFLLTRFKNSEIEDIEARYGDNLERKKNKILYRFKFNALLNENKAGVFLLIALNLILLVLNIIDVKWVWFGFEWEGQYLKQFVHTGTYLLILSMLISIFIVLYFFRGNLNFYTQNTLLKNLSFIWLVQNAVLAISVGIRNYHYVEYFSLAYKRIGVFVFLLLVICGLFTVFIKVRKKKSTFYLLKTNSYVVMVVLVITSLVNWDSLIARYNFANAHHSFLHLDFLSDLSDKTLPYLDKSLIELKEIEVVQKSKFPFEEKYMTPEEYHRIIQERKHAFKKRWETTTLIEWNLAEYRAYKKLFSE